MSLLIIQANQFPVPGLFHWSPVLNAWAFWSFRPISSQVPGLFHWSPVLTVSFFSSFSFLSPTFRAFLISCFRDLFLLYSFITLMGWSLEFSFSAWIPYPPPPNAGVYLMLIKSLPCLNILSQMYSHCAPLVTHLDGPHSDHLWSVNLSATLATTDIVRTME